MFRALRHFSSLFFCLINLFHVGQYHNIDITGTGDHSFNALHHFHYFSFLSLIFFALGSIRLLILPVQVLIRLTHFPISVPFSFVSSIFLVFYSLRTLILWVQVITRLIHFVISFLYYFVSSIFFVLRNI